MLNDFIKYLEEQVKNGCIYVWGGQGQVATESFIKKCESGNDEKRVLKLYQKRTAAGYVPEKIKAFDCSGLGMYWLYNLKKITSGDMTANGMKGKCTMIQKSHVKRGDWLFRVYTSGSNKGRAYHIGYMVSDTEFVEAYGRDRGVIKRKLADVGTYWNAFGRPVYFKDEIDTAEEQAEHASFNRNLKKGCKGDDVRELQKLLNDAGDDLKVDGEFGKKTLAAVKEFQKKKKLKVDGIAGKKTITALGGKWVG